MEPKGVLKLAGSLQETAQLKDEPADLVFMGGDIFTIDEKNPHVEALAVKGERILAVGNYADIKPRIQQGHTRVVDLQGQTLLPGFIEAHQHALLQAATKFLYTNISAYSYDCSLRTAGDIKQIIQDAIAATNPKESPLPWCMFLGWDIELICDLPKLNADELDKLSNEIPLLVIAQSGHAAWVNHKTFEVCKITSAEQCPPGGTYVTENGELTGLLLEEPAIKSVTKHCPKMSGMFMQAVEAIHYQWKDYASRGFTTVTELDYTPMWIQDMYLSLTAGLLDSPIRLALYINGQQSNLKSHIIESSKLWLAGVKFWSDGSPHAGTAAVNEPYLDNDLTRQLSFPPPPNNCGHLNWKDDELFEKVKVFHDQGKQVSIHAHGERAIDQSLKVYKQLLKPGDDRRHRLEHVGLITEDQLKLCGELGVATSIFVDHLYFYGKTFADSIFGRERTNRWAPLATAIKYLGKISIHQDHPTFPGPPYPFANIKTAVTRTQRDDPNTVYDDNHSFSITVEKAIKAYTIGPAYQLFRENEIGSLEVGKFADLVILSTNPYQLDPMKLDTDVKVVETYIGGRCNNVNKK